MTQAMWPSRELARGTINACVGDDVVYFNIGCDLWSCAPSGDGMRRLRRFKGASRGLRGLYVARSGALFASPEGTALHDSEKGLWRSRDRGATWIRVLSLEELPNPVSIWSLAEGGDAVFYAGVYTTAPEKRLAKIYRSRDGGLTWQCAFHHVTARHIHAIATGVGHGTVYASFGDDFGVWKSRGVVRSVDGGDSWQVILPGMPQVVPIVATPKARLFGSDSPGGARIFRTTDDITFETVLADNEETFFFWMRRDADTGCVFAGTIREAPPGTPKIYRSVDEGKTWSVFYEFPGDVRGDGTANAAAPRRSMMVAQVRTGGNPQPPFFIDTSLCVSPPRRLPPRLRTQTQRALGGLMLLASSPVILAAATATKVSSSGPVFFRQWRTGLHGRAFQILKIRTMVPDPERPDRQKATRVGKVLRTLSIDELPQFWNVVRGDMALVGPRPHPLELDKEYTARITELRNRYHVLPGLTGLAQVSGARGRIRSLEEMRRRIDLDLEYVRRRSLFLDLRILCRTILGGFIDRRP